MNIIDKKIPILKVKDLNGLYGLNFDNIACMGNSNIEFKSSWKGNRYVKLFNPSTQKKVYLKEEKIQNKGKYFWWIFPYKTTKGTVSKLEHGDIIEFNQFAKSSGDSIRVYFIFSNIVKSANKNVVFYLSGFVTSDYKTAVQKNKFMLK